MSNVHWVRFQSGELRQWGNSPEGDVPEGATILDAPYVPPPPPPPPPPTVEERAAQVRYRRDALLAASDFTQLADAQVQKGPWVAYRQALRDLTKQPGFPGSVTWPDPPAVSAG